MHLSPEQLIALSALVYANLSGDVGSTIQPISDNTYDEIEFKDPEFKSLPSLYDYTLISYQSLPSGLAAAAFQAPDNPDGTKGEIVFSFRGTEANTWQDIMADLQLASIGTPAVGPNQFYDAEQFVSSVLASNVNSGYTLTGHSLGGAVAQYVAYKTNHSATTFDAPGIAQLLPLGTNMHRTDVIDYVNKNDLIGNYGIPYGVSRVIDSGAGVGLNDTGLAIAMMSSPLSGIIGRLVAATILKESVAELQQGASDNPLMEEHNMASMLDENGNMREHLPPGGTQIVGAVIGVIVGTVVLPYKLGNALVYAIGDNVAGLIVDGADGVQKVWHFAEQTVSELAYYSQEGVMKFVDTSIVLTKGVSSITLGPFNKNVIVPAGEALADLIWNAYSGVKSAFDLLTDSSSIIYGKTLISGDAYEGITGTEYGDFIDLGGGGGWAYGGKGDDTIVVKSGENTIYGQEGDDTMVAQGGNNNLIGGDGNDTIIGGTDDDWVSGWDGNDYLDPGTGNRGGASGGKGDDTYVIGRGYGKVDISDKETDDGLAWPHEAVYIHKTGNKIVFKPGITIDDLVFTRSTHSLFIKIKNDSTQITIENFFAGTLGFGFGEIPVFKFDNGDILTMYQVRSLVEQGIDDSQNIWGTSEDDSLYGMGGNDTIHGGGGNDYINGGDGDDILIDNYTSDDFSKRPAYVDSNNIIDGGSGNDIIKSGSGNDILYGGEGNDIIRDEGGTNTIYGGDGDDQIYTRYAPYIPGVETETKNLIYSGRGNDYIDTEGSNNIIYIEKNSGKDTLFIKSRELTKGNKIVFSQDFSPNDFTIEQRGQNSIDLILKSKIDDTEVAALGYYDRKVLGKTYGTAGNISSIEFHDGTVWNRQDMIYLAGHKEPIIYTGNVDRNIDYSFSSYHRHIISGSGNDRITTNSGDDIIDGGAGDDIISGGLGSDTYIFKRGSGRDTIIETFDGADLFYPEQDTINLGEGIGENDVSITKSADGLDMIVSILGTSDSITVKNHFSPNSNIEQISFANGKTWKTSDIQAQLTLTKGTDGNDALRHPDDYRCEIYGYDGDDKLYASYDGSLLDGGQGDDELYGNRLEEVMIGGLGNDYLAGGDGSDVYYFGPGWGNDIIDEAISSLDRNRFDEIRFEKIDTRNIRVTRNGGDLLLTLCSPEVAVQDMDSITIKNYFGIYNESTHKYEIPQGSSTVENLGLDEGSLQNGIFDRIVDSMQPQYNIYGSGNGDNLYGDYDSNSLYGLGGDDFIYGKYGNDQLYGDSGNDFYDGGFGDDYMYDTAGNDTYKLSEGSDRVLDESGNDRYNIEFSTINILDYEGDDNYQINGTGSIKDIGGNDTYIIYGANMTIEDSGSSNDKMKFLNASKYDILFTKVDDNLVISSDNVGRVTMKNWFQSTDNRIETITAYDGSLQIDRVGELIQAMAGFSAHNNGLSWYGGLCENPTEVQSIVGQYWTTNVN